MKAAAGVAQRLGKQFQVVAPVVVIQKARLPVVAALAHVLGNAGKVNAGKSGHAATSPSGSARRDLKNAMGA